jgi:hypothetical protein
MKTNTNVNKKGVLGFVTGVVMVASAVVGLMFLNGMNDVNVVKEHGYMVLDNNDSKDETTIVATITDDSDVDKDGYIEATNVFDKKDTVAIGKGFAKGEVVLITFNQDTVEKIELNKLNIGGKVEGQKIIK